MAKSYCVRHILKLKVMLQKKKDFGSERNLATRGYAKYKTASHPVPYIRWRTNLTVRIHLFAIQLRIEIVNLQIRWTKDRSLCPSHALLLTGNQACLVGLNLRVYIVVA